MVLDDRGDEAIGFVEIEIHLRDFGVRNEKTRRENGGLGLQSHAQYFQRKFNEWPRHCPRAARRGDDGDGGLENAAAWKLRV